MRSAFGLVFSTLAIWAGCTVTAFAADGDLDTSFGNGLGYSVEAFDLGGSNQDLVTSVLVQSSGNIVLVGSAADSSSPSPSNIAMARFHPDGSPDNSFGTNGKSVISTFAVTGSSAPQVYGGALDGNDGIYLTGYAGPFGSGSIGFVAHVTANGQLDGGFGSQGFFAISNAVLQGIAVDRNDKPVAVGLYAFGGGLELFVARLTSGGTLDPAFNSGGPFTQSIGSGPPFKDRVGAVTFDTSGRIYLAAARQQTTNSIQPAIVRLTASGSIDTTCNQTGVIVAPYGDARILPASILFRDGHHGIWTGSNGGGGNLLAYDFDADDCSGGPGTGLISTNSAGGGFAAVASDGSVYISFTNAFSPNQAGIVTLHNTLPYSSQPFSAYPSVVSQGEGIVMPSGRPLQTIRQQVSGTNFDFVVARFQNDRIFFANFERDAPN